MTCHYHDYYIGQAGSGVGSIYKGAVYQKGRGFGSFLRGLFRTVFPLVKSGLKTIGKEALRSGSYFINDVVNNVPPKEAFNSRVSESVGNLKRKAETKIDDLVGSGVTKRRRRKQSRQMRLPVRRVKKSSRSSDIFD